MVKIPTAGTDPNKTGGGDYIDQEGKFHFSIEGARDLSESDKPRIEFDFVVLGSTAQGQEGRKHKESFYLQGADDEKTKSCFNRLLKFLCSIGFYDEAQWNACKERGEFPDVDFDPEAAIGSQFCTHVTLKPGTKNPNQKFSNIQFDFWAVGDEEADEIPKSPDWIDAVANNGMLPTRKGTLRKPGTKPVTNGAANKPTPASQQKATPPSKPAAPASRPAPKAATPPDDDGIPF